MMKISRLLLAAALTLAPAIAVAQTGNLGAGQVWGNDSATSRPSRPTDVSPLLDRAFGSGQGSVLVRGAATWDDTRTPVLGLAGTAIGTLGFSGNTSGTATITPQAAAGTPNLVLPDTSGTFAVGAASPLVLSATTGGLSCPTCVTSSGGGAITGTSPISVSAAGVVSITSPLPLTNGGTNAALVANNGGVVYSDASAMAILANPAAVSRPLLSGNAAAPTWATSSYPSGSGAGSMLAALTANTITATRTPVLGLNGTATGTLGFSGSTSGTMTMQPGAAAGTGTLTIPNTAGTLVSNSSAPLAIGAATGTISITGVANQVLAGSTPAFTATPTLGTNGGTGGQITFNGATSGSAILKVAAAAGTSTFQLPVGNGSSGQALTTDGAGITSWTPVGGTGTVTSFTCGGVTITTTGACPELFYPVNCSLATSVAANILGSLTLPHSVPQRHGNDWLDNAAERHRSALDHNQRNGRDARQQQQQGVSVLGGRVRQLRYRCSGALQCQHVGEHRVDCGDVFGN